jgi:hypothetical protein
MIKRFRLALGIGCKLGHPYNIVYFGRVQQLKLMSLGLLAALAGVAAKGVCNDLHRDCANWAKKGHCSGPRLALVAHQPALARFGSERGGAF